MSLTVKTRIRILLGLFILVFVPALIMQLSSSDQVVRDFDEIVYTSEYLIGKSKELGKLVVDMESGYRGFIITGKEDALEPFNHANGVFNQILDELRNEMGGQIEALKCLEKIEHLHYKWLGLCAMPEIQVRRQIKESMALKAVVQEKLELENHEKNFLHIKENIELLAQSLEGEAALCLARLQSDVFISAASHKNYLLTEQNICSEIFYNVQVLFREHYKILEDLLSSDAGQMEILTSIGCQYHHWLYNIATPQIEAQVEFTQEPVTFEDMMALAAQEKGKQTFQLLKNELRIFSRLLTQSAKDRYEHSKANIRVINIATVLIGIVGFILIGIAAIVLRKAILHPIDKLEEGMDMIALGDLRHNIELEGTDEFSRLATSLNEMTAQLQDKTDHLNHVNQELWLTNQSLRSHQEELELTNQQLESEVVVRTQAEEALEATVENLENANRDLENFAFVAAHDLKTPIRGIGSLASIIQSDYQDVLDKEGQDYLNMLLLRVERMYDQVTGILEYSRLSHADGPKKVVELDRVLKNVVKDIDAPDHIQINVATDLPVIECDPHRAFQIFRNLINNAVKFMDKPQGFIDVQCEEQEDQWVFCVIDNGPGIAEKYHSKVFEVFQTLTRRDEREATGIGLTLTRKIVEGYNGRIWIESNPGAGTTFLFTLPKAMVAPKMAV